MVDNRHFGGTVVAWAAGRQTIRTVTMRPQPTFVTLSEEEADERRWAESFAATQDFLAELGDKALADFLAENTEPLDPDRL